MMLIDNRILPNRSPPTPS